MPNGITWPNDVRKRSKAEGTMLLAFGNPILTYNGHAEKDIAKKLVLFCFKVVMLNETPEAAFAEVFKKKGKPSATT